jgi:alkylation response protein AidB-like acyl-CoA dehydrogenase
MGPAAAALRQELRRLVREHVPRDYLGAFTDDPEDLQVAQDFCALLASRGLLCLAWPQELGGLGASPWEQTVVREEMWAHHEPRGAQYMGVNWVGPAIMRHGTARQKDAHLPPIARGEVIWCQGFSEPEAGSDLASLRTRATPAPDGRGFLVHGQKIWTSYALLAQWCFLLARTSTGERKQQGLTVFLVPMDAPGIEVRPIKAMLGPHHLSEVFLDGVHLTEEDALGPVGDGWRVVQEVLAFERVGIARYARCERLLLAAPRVLGDQWEQLPEELRGRWARMLTHCRRARLLAYRVIAKQSSPGGPTPRTSRGMSHGGAEVPGMPSSAEATSRTSRGLSDGGAEVPGMPPPGVATPRTFRGMSDGGAQVPGMPSSARVNGVPLRGGTVRPEDAAAYRIAVTRLDQDSAEVLMDILGLAVLAGEGEDRWFRLEVEDHWRYAQASTVASGSIEMQRILLARAMLR